MRDWRLELNSQSGFQGCVSTVFSIKWTILEVIVKNDKNSKGSSRPLRFEILGYAELEDGQRFPILGKIVPINKTIPVKLGEIEK